MGLDVTHRRPAADPRDDHASSGPASARQGHTAGSPQATDAAAGRPGTLQAVNQPAPAGEVPVTAAAELPVVAAGELPVATLASLAGGGNVFAASELAQRLAEADIRLEIAECERRHARDALESLPQPVIVTDPFDDVVLMSGAARRLFGVPPGVRPVGPLCQFVRDAGLLALVARTRGLHSRGATRRVRRSVLTALGRRVFDLHLLCVCDRGDGTPSPWGVVTFLEETRCAQRQEIAELTEAIAHEFRTPLTTLKACTEMLLDGEVTEAAARQQMHQAVSAEIDRLTRLVENMQLLARIDAGHLPPSRQDVQVLPLLQETAALLLPHAQAAGLSLSVTAAGEDASVLADRDLLKQALMNLVCNAVKYTPRGGAVTLSVDAGPAWVNVYVQDSGVGIAPADLPFVFDRFYRGEAQRRMAGGSGLGLPLVKQIIETVHGGSVTLESQPGKGTTARITLPRAGVAPAAAPDADTSSEADTAGEAGHAR